jgi:hypothetical protein
MVIIRGIKLHGIQTNKLPDRGLSNYCTPNGSIDQYCSIRHISAVDSAQFHVKHILCLTPLPLQDTLQEMLLRLKSEI